MPRRGGEEPIAGEGPMVDARYIAMKESKRGMQFSDYVHSDRVLAL